MSDTCPYCGGPLEKGFMTTHWKSQILWIPETASWAPSVSYTEDEVIEKYHGVILARGWRPFKKNHPWKAVVTAAPMDFCRTCQKGIVSLADTEEPEEEHC